MIKGSRKIKRSVPAVITEDSSSIRQAIIGIGTEFLSKEQIDKFEAEGVTLRKKATKLEGLLRTVFDNALKGKPWAVTMILERIENKQPLGININIEDKNLSDKELEEEIKRLQGIIDTPPVDYTDISEDVIEDVKKEDKADKADKGDKNENL